MADLTVAQNATNCIAKSTGFTGETVYNLCNGTTQFVPFGALDYFTVAFVATMCAAFIGICLLGLGVAFNETVGSWWRWRQYKKESGRH